MTRDTVQALALEVVTLVTRLAGRDRVHAQEREAREVVVEADAGGEAVLVVTLRTILAERALMHVVCAMARDAGRALVRRGVGSRVAVVAGHLCVGAHEREARAVAVLEHDW